MKRHLRLIMLFSGGLLILGLVAFKPFRSTQEIKDRKLVTAFETQEGDGARVKRVFPTRNYRNHDPFVLLDEFFVTPPAGFPMHPHRGFEAITYMVGGSFNHQDNMGNNSTVGPGGAQRFTAGKGMWHSEMPGPGETAHGLQLWINLEKTQKGIEPGYQEVKATQFPATSINGVTTRQIVGKNGPVILQTGVDYRDISMIQNAEEQISLEKGFGGFLYLMEGQVKVDDLLVNTGQALFLELDDEFTIKAQQQSRIFLISGKPHYQPIKQRGPYVD